MEEFQVVGGVTGTWRHFRWLKAFQVVGGISDSFGGISCSWGASQVMSETIHVIGGMQDVTKIKIALLRKLDKCLN